MCKFIIHDDMDGIVAGLIFKNFNPEFQFNGVYDLSTFYLNERLGRNDVGVDLDINHIKCYGHHISPLENNLSENPNKIFLNDFYDEYFEKCPLNAALILAHNYNMPITNLRQIALLVYCDGFNHYFKKYTPNCKKWLERFNMQYITEALEQHEEEIQNIIDNEITPIYNKTNHYVKLKIKIEDNKLQNKEVIKEFCKYVIEVLNLDADFSIYDIDYCIESKYIVKTLPINNKEEYLKLTSRMNKLSNKIVSAAMTTRKQMNITMIEDCYLY